MSERGQKALKKDFASFEPLAKVQNFLLWALSAVTDENLPLRRLKSKQMRAYASTVLEQLWACSEGYLLELPFSHCIPLYVCTLSTR